MKVVINTNSQGFSLSREAIQRLLELGIEKEGLGLIKTNTKEFRINPLLIRVVEELGERVNGGLSYLEVVNAHDDDNWKIFGIGKQESIGYAGIPNIVELENDDIQISYPKPIDIVVIKDNVKIIFDNGYSTTYTPDDEFTLRNEKDVIIFRSVPKGIVVDNESHKIVNEYRKLSKKFVFKKYHPNGEEIVSDDPVGFWYNIACSWIGATDKTNPNIDEKYWYPYKILRRDDIII